MGSLSRNEVMTNQKKRFELGCDPSRWIVDWINGVPNRDLRFCFQTVGRQVPIPDRKGRVPVSGG